jgi:hypothetical protein
MPEVNGAASSDPARSSESFIIGEDLEDHSWKARIFRPITMIAAALVIGVLLLIAFLEQRSIGGDLPVPQVSYTLLRNEGKTEGVPIAIKVNQVTVFLIHDPIQDGAGASRARQVQERLQATLEMLRTSPGKTMTLDIDSPLPSIVLSRPDGTERRTIVQLEPGDLALAGDTDGKRVARVWAERLTDVIKVFVFGEPPKFTTGTEFGDSLETMYSTAQKHGGAISKGSLDFAFAALSDHQKQVLENIPVLTPELQPEAVEQ